MRFPIGTRVVTTGPPPFVPDPEMAKDVVGEVMDYTSGYKLNGKNNNAYQLQIGSPSTFYTRLWWLEKDLEEDFIWICKQALKGDQQ